MKYTPEEVKAAMMNVATITNVEAVNYELRSSWWMCYVPANSWLGTIVANYLAWKCNRRYRRYAESMSWYNKLKREGKI